MIKALLFDFSRVLLFPKDKSYKGGLNELNNKLREESDYRLLDHFYLNTELLNFLKNQNNLPVYIFTQETIQESPEIKDKIKGIFRRIFSGRRMGLEKSNPDSFAVVAKEMGFDSSEIFYTDDTGKNVKAAKTAGCSAVKYLDNAQIISELQKI